MTNEIITNKEILSMEQLDNVSGGTRAKLNEIIAGLEKFKKTPAISSTMIGILDNIPIVGSVPLSMSNNALAPMIEHVLKKTYGIESNIRIGVLGTGWGEKENTYSDSCGSLTHQQVLGIINRTFSRTI